MRWHPGRIERLEQAAKKRREGERPAVLLVIPDADRDVVRADVWETTTNLMVRSDADRYCAELVARGVTPPVLVYFDGEDMNV